jgi:choline/glycine/proline betaine transport protein
MSDHQSSREQQSPKGLKKHFDVHGPVFWPSAILIVVFIAITLIVGEPMQEIFKTVQTGISNVGGWFFILCVNIFLVFCFYLAFSKYGRIRLGGQDARPEFSTSAWFAMLFSAGMGIGILFWSVAEPVSHFMTPPESVLGDIDPNDIPNRTRAAEAMGLTYLHWGMHAWSIYALVGLALAFFAYSRKLPLSLRSVFYPLLGDRIYGWIGDVIDIVAVISTLFGLATSLGFGVSQVAAGLTHVFGIPDSIWLEVGLIMGITGVATISVVLGVDKGVKVLSELNMRLAVVFLVFLIIVGPTLFIFDSFIQNIGYYTQNLAEMSFWAETYQQTDWQNGWTVFYWAWWISWSPFVGMFIARVSRGRTVREFILGVLIVPSLLTFFWLSAFGGSALFLEINGIADMAGAADEPATALFKLLDQFPLSSITSIIGIILVTIFFVTSSDSGSLVIDSITAGGKLDAPVGQRIFWAQTEGAVAAVLLLGGGLGALQTAAITTGLPFAFILLVMCYSLRQGLQREYAELVELDKQRDRKSYEKVIRDVVSRRREKQEA